MLDLRLKLEGTQIFQDGVTSFLLMDGLLVGWGVGCSYIVLYFRDFRTELETFLLGGVEGNIS